MVDFLKPDWAFVQSSFGFVELVMGHVINLRTSRKRVEKQKDAVRAAANRLSYGRSRQQKNLEEARQHQAKRSIDEHRIETGIADEISGHQTLDRDRRS